MQQNKHQNHHVLEHVNHEDGSHLCDRIVTITYQLKVKWEVHDAVFCKSENLLEHPIDLKIKVCYWQQKGAKERSISWCLNDKNRKMKD